MLTILTPQEAADILRVEAASDYPQINFILPAIDEFIKTATGKDWTATDKIDPLAKMVASILLVRWFEEPAMIGKLESNDSLVTIISQLHAKAITEKKL